MTNADRIATELMGALLVAQGDSLKVAERSVDQIDEILGMKWLQVLAILKNPAFDYQTNRQRTKNVLDSLIQEVEDKTLQTLLLAASSARNTTREAFRNTLPTEVYDEELTTEFREAKAPQRRKKRVLGALSEAELRRIIARGKYGQRLRRWSSQLTRADQAARILAEGIANGLSEREIASTIAPLVRSYVQAAKRIVRTEVARIHNEVAEQTFKQFGDLIVGYQIIAILDAVTRPHHATRHGKIWYTFKAPYATDRPALPDEPNCRCTYTVLLRTGNRGFGVPQPSTRRYAQWFDRQTVSTKQRIVGKARWTAVKQKVARPSWNDFISPTTGRLIKTDTLQSKSPAQIRKTREQLDSRQKKQAAIAETYK